MADSQEQLLQHLKEETGYCACSDGSTLPMLERFLGLLQEKTTHSNRAAIKKAEYKDFAEDYAAYAKVDAEIKQFLETPLGWTDWFVFGLEKAGLVTHNFRITDVWITEKGTALLKNLKRFPALEEKGT
ncbi:MAG TPA: hypothetical protein PKZ00_11210 [Elusimicrobiota bacterium]|nr:hypothetical protein [Elusimicrobiota bacterium]